MDMYVALLLSAAAAAAAASDFVMKRKGWCGGFGFTLIKRECVSCHGLSSFGMN